VLELIDTGAGIVGGDTITWDLGELGAGETRYIEYRVRVSEAVGPGNTFFTNESLLSCGDEEENHTDNSELLTVAAYRPTSGGEGVEYTPRPELAIEKRHNAPFGVPQGTVVDYTITIANGGGLAYYATLYDILVDENGNVVFEQDWPLERIYPDEEIRIDYSIEYNGGTEPGTYTNYAWVEAIGGHPSLNPFYGNIADTETVSAPVTILGQPGGGGAPTVTGDAVIQSSVEEEDESEGGSVDPTQWLQEIRDAMSGHMTALLAFAGTDVDTAMAASEEEDVEGIDIEIFSVSSVEGDTTESSRIVIEEMITDGAEARATIVTHMRQLPTLEKDEEEEVVAAVGEDQGASAAGALGLLSWWWLLLILLIVIAGTGATYRTYVAKHQAA
jgi:hypothetical protein